MINKIKYLYRTLVNENVLFTKIEIYRNRNKYPSKILNYGDDKKVTIHFIHRYITNNTGDLACGYYQYFMDEYKDYRCIVHDINYVDISKISKNDVAIIGGGGLLNANPEWTYNINLVSKKAKKTIIWSAGFNTHYGLNIKLKIDWGNIDLVSVRDYNKDFRYSPCATCAMNYFDLDYTKKRNIGLVSHKDNNNDIPQELRQFESISNNASSKEIIEFIATSDIILTNSYHAAYWSILLKKKCVVFSPFSEKFNYFKYKPGFYSANLQEDIENAQVYEDALNDARLLTNEFVIDIVKTIESCNQIQK